MVKFALLLLFVFFSCLVSAQFSPGDLCKAHANLEGVENCTKCHPAGKQLSNQQCLNCHKEINTLITQSRGYHSSGDVKGKNCWSCHKDHLGRNYQIIKFDSKKFDHNKAGFQLKGKHSQLECNKCHKPDLISDGSLKKRKGTYLGMGRDCINCHKDVHQNAFGKNCQNCHSENAFKPASGFDHNKAKFKLIGAHERIDCIKCHPKETRNGEMVQKFSGLSFQNCTPCHKDAHEGKLGADCRKCHNERKFSEVNTADFDHNRTNYPLSGRHIQVKCQDCHGTKRNSHPKHDDCMDCHKDKHNGQLASQQDKITKCESCHTVNGFTPSSFTTERHNQSKFQLLGSHLSIPCNACHYKQNTWSFRNIGEKCVDCHNNPHGKEITEKYAGADECRNCHNMDAWNNIKFDHNTTAFNLTGQHSKQTCARCHVKSVQGTREYRFKSLGKNCETCHKDIHRGQFAEEKMTDCKRCHAFDDWKAAAFNHNAARFKLSGAHERIECAKCHKQRQDTAGTYTFYKLEDFRCAACHS